MTNDRSENGVPGYQVPEWVRVGFVMLGILAALGLVVVIALFISLEVQQHDFQQRAQSNKAVATSQAAADAEAFYRDLRAVTKTVTPTQSQIHAIGLRYAVLVGPVVVQHGSAVVAFDAQQGYADPGSFSGGQGSVQLCYTASVPIAPATTPSATLSRVACPAGRV